MKKEQVNELMKVLEPLVVSCQSLTQQIQAAELVFKRHSADLYNEYRQELKDEMRLRGDQSRQNATALQNLRKVLLED
jgi:hypothetical protein